MFMTDGINNTYEPTSDDEKVLSALQRGRDEGEPWGRATPRYLVDVTDLSKGRVNFSLRNLRLAGWIQRPVRGCYELVEDPSKQDSK